MRTLVGLALVLVLAGTPNLAGIELSASAQGKIELPGPNAGAKWYVLIGKRETNGNDDGMACRAMIVSDRIDLQAARTELERANVLGERFTDIKTYGPFPTDAAAMNSLIKAGWLQAPNPLFFNSNEGCE
jgi:hypothetical protein